MTDYARDCQNRFPSLWLATAVERDLSEPLDGDASCDVAVIGAGYTGLATAIELARGGANVRIIDGGFPGWGGSGRNSGAVIRGFKNSRSALVKEFGDERGRAMADFGGRVCDIVFDLIARYDIQCDLVRSGWLLPAHNKAGLRRVRDRVDTWTADGFPGLAMIDRDTLARMIGSEAYIGGMIDSHGASLNPLSYARGLARAALGHGAGVHGQTRADRLSRTGGRWRVDTPRGAITAEKVVVATDAYSGGLVPSVDRSFASIHTNIVATVPLPGDIADSILPGEQAVSDIRRILLYWHKDPHGRVLFGTRGTLGGPRSDADFAHVEAALHRVYPQLRGQPIEFRWSGRIALTGNFVPHINEPEPGLWTAHGYCGRGVAMATAYGTLMGKAILANGSLGKLPVPDTAAPTMPPKPLRDLGVVSATHFFRLLDLVA
ncbi:glycine/D-amino acid oxidase-like deaminating enzyme [Pseudochelatococcus lubricantis]|uniref:Glycine/D-amino acid oxidase-like deaminating enzyme n=1 Tax=Pseudochelatococcus lubricantis TaxID=1538102 RepID=A0ABX0V2X2_9HYPH|nr:FAD-binding oxidoreductase [Pseudochelatococcus lubricantis]NIJ58715.1 glycine/D-amino acid oxidase-like deaminating enzyme [Pseudochelatococcus lubricantis]